MREIGFVAIGAILSAAMLTIYPSKPVEVKPQVVVHPTPVKTEVVTCPEIDYKKIADELQFIIDKNDLRVTPIFGRK